MKKEEKIIVKCMVGTEENKCYFKQGVLEDYNLRLVVWNGPGECALIKGTQKDLERFSYEEDRIFWPEDEDLDEDLEEVEVTKYVKMRKERHCRDKKRGNDRYDVIMSHCYEVYEINEDKVKFSEFDEGDGEKHFIIKNGITYTKTFKGWIKGYEKDLE